MCGVHLDYCDVIISCLDSHSDGTHSLQRMLLWASDTMQHFSKSVLMKKQTHLQLGWPERVNIFVFFYFCANYSFNSLALVGFGEKRVFVGFLGVPALTGDSRGCFVDLAPVILSTTPETISGVAGAKTALGGLSYRAGKKKWKKLM